MRKSQGFSLIEAAIVLVIITTLIASVAVPFAERHKQKRIWETRKSLEEIREALIGFAMANKRLPCPDLDSNPSAPGYGSEELSCATDPTAEGYLPFRTLGIPTIMDGWGSLPVTNLRVGHWRYRVDRNFAVPFTLTTTCNSRDELTIVDYLGVPQNETGACGVARHPVAIVYSTGPNTTPDGQNASFELTPPACPSCPSPNPGVYQSGESANFDDMVIWIGDVELKGALVRAGQLP